MHLMCEWCWTADHARGVMSSVMRPHHPHKTPGQRAAGAGSTRQPELPRGASPMICWPLLRASLVSNGDLVPSM